MTEQVVRYRGATRDENGVPGTASPATLWALEIAPRGGSRFVTQSRDGDDVQATVYFDHPADVVDGDELAFRGKRYKVIVNDWASGGRGGLEVLCVRGGNG